MAIHHYQVTITEVEASKDAAVMPQSSPASLSFHFSDREDVLKAINHIQQGTDLNDEQASRVGLALRLLGPVMVEQRKTPLFVDFMPHFKQFMHQLKTLVKQS